MLNFLKKIFSIFLIFNLTFVSSAQAATTFDDINGDGTGFDVSTQDGSPSFIAFNNDGTKMFVVGTSGDDVNEYTLSVGFDLTSTVTFVDSFDVSGEDTNLRTITFNNDGTKMYVVGAADDDINSYTLFCPFAVTNSSKCEEPPQDKDCLLYTSPSPRDS